jgi:hypothetical protein
VIAADLPFARVILVDFEFVARLGERPDPVCLVFNDMSTGQTVRLWRDQLGEQAPFDVGPDTLIVSFVFNAEGACFAALNWPMPPNVLDLSAEFKRQVNGKGIPRKRADRGAAIFRAEHFRAQAQGRNA